MNKKLKKHLGYYFSLLAILFLGLIVTLLAAPNIKFQSIIIVITVVFYVVWGILHHFVNHELTTKIVVEYVLIGTFGISILFFMIMGGIV